MTRAEIKNTPEIVDLMLSESVMPESKEKLHKRLDEICNMAIKALEQEPKTGWIPVSERLPELLEDVLMCDNGDDIQVGYYRNGHYANGREYFEWYSYDKDDYDFEPIAWMPLPEPYKAESEDKE